MRIGLNLLYARPNIGGSWQYIKSIMSLLQEFGGEHEFVVYCTRDSASIVPDKANFRKCQIPLAGGGQLLRIGFENTMFESIVRRHGVEVLHWFANTCPLFSRVPSLVTVHDLLAFSRYGRASLRHWYRRMVIPRSIIRASMLAAVSEATADDLKTRFGIEDERIEIIPYTVKGDFVRASQERVTAFKEKYHLPEKFWLYVAHGYPHKNHARLLEAYHKLRNKNEEGWPLVLRGDFGLENKLKEKAREWQIAKSTIWLPPLKDEEMPVLLSAATAFIFPSLFEGCGIPVLEALSCGCPVLASDIPAMREFASSAWAFFDPTSVDAIAETMGMFQEHYSFTSDKPQNTIGLKKYERSVISSVLLNTYGRISRDKVRAPRLRCPAVHGQEREKPGAAMLHDATAIKPLPIQNSTRILFILPIANDAHCLARVNVLKRSKVDACVLAFTRETYPAGRHAGNCTSLGCISHGRYFQRLFPLIRSLTRVRSAVVNADCVYTFSLDLLAIAYCATRRLGRSPAFVYDVGDIREAFLRNTPFGYLLRFLERFLIHRTNAIVVATSQAYITEYFKGIQSLHEVQYHLIENKVDSRSLRCAVSKTKSSSSSPLVIGYFGLLRCSCSLAVLRELALASHGKYFIYLRGYPLGLPALQSKIKQISNMEYGGAYRNPDDLSEIYDRIDLGWIAHAHGVANSLWARANRFYECCYFKKPMIAQRGTQDAKLVEEYDLGVVIDMKDVRGCVQMLQEISFSDVERWRTNLTRLDERIYILKDDHEDLLRKLHANLRGHQNECAINVVRDEQKSFEDVQGNEQAIKKA